MGKQLHQDEMFKRSPELLTFLLGNLAVRDGTGNTDIEQIELDIVCIMDSTPF